MARQWWDRCRQSRTPSSRWSSSSTSWSPSSTSSTASAGSNRPSWRRSRRRSLQNRSVDMFLQNRLVDIYLQNSSVDIFLQNLQIIIFCFLKLGDSQGQTSGSPRDHRRRWRDDGGFDGETVAEPRFWEKPFSGSGDAWRMRTVRNAACSNGPIYLWISQHDLSMWYIDRIGQNWDGRGQNHPDTRVLKSVYLIGFSCSEIKL